MQEPALNMHKDVRDTNPGEGNPSPGARSISEETSRAIALTRFPLVLFVIADHFFSLETIYTSSGEFAPSAHAATRTAIRLFELVCGEFYIPCFFFISGFLFFAGGFAKGIFAGKLRRRCRSLLLPYMAWNLIAVFLSWAVFPLLDAEIQGHAGGFSMTVSQFFTGFIAGANDAGLPHAGNLWYVRELMTVIILSPVIYYCLKNYCRIYLICTGAVWASVILFSGPIYLRFLSSALFFFSSGAYFSLNEVDPLSVSRRLWKRMLGVGTVVVLLIMVTALMIGSETASVRILQVLTVPCGMILVLALADRWGRSKLRQSILGQRAMSDILPGVVFFLFVSHSLVLWRFKIKLFQLMNPTSDAEFLLAYLASFVLLTAVLMGVYWLIGRFLPWFQRLISGRL